MRDILITATLICGQLIWGVAPLAAQPSGPTRLANGNTLLTVAVQGQVHRAPDIAQISAGVTTQASDSKTALQTNSQHMQDVIGALKAAHIADRDIQTSGLRIFPQYNDSNRGQRRLTGYQVTNTLAIQIRQLAQLPAVLEQLIRQGATDIDGPEFMIGDLEIANDQARQDALDHAQHRAASYAKALGMSVKRLVSIFENQHSQSAGPMVMAATLRSAPASMAPPVALGENTVTVNLEAVFELGQ